MNDGYKDIKKYFDLEKCIEDRLDNNLSNRYNLLPNVATAEYIHRLNVLKQAYPNEAKQHLSKLMFNAYIGTIKYYEKQVK